MALNSEGCDLGRLDQFLRARPIEDFPQDLEAHLLVCPACRDKLDDLAGGSRWWAEVRKYLGGDGASELSRTSGATVSPREAGTDLDFLEPSDNPASLGRLGAYEVLEVLGRGGMGIVLKAFDAALHRPVAIKVLAAEYAANGAARKRFAREAQAAAAVIHDHVVPVHAVDANATPPYLVMAMIPGRSLEQRIDHSGPLELKEILRIGMQTASGLAAAHAQGLVHRDIKPANIMLENGIERVRITDFGLARAVDDASVTQKGVLTGTPQYMAPEQARGENVDQRADLFSLGSTLYAMATGRSPFRGDSAVAVLRQVCDIDPPPIRSINPDIPAWLEGIIRKLHAKDLAQRFQSAAEVADLLERCLAHVQQPDQHSLPRLADDLGRQVMAPKSSRRIRRWLSVAAAALAFGFLGSMAVFFRPSPTDSQGDQEPGSEPIVGTNPKSFGSAFLDDGFREGSDQLRDRLDGLRQSLSTPSPGEGVGMEPAVNRVRQRAEVLRRDLNPTSEPSVDPVDTQVESIRRRLELLRQDLGRRLE